MHSKPASPLRTYLDECRALAEKSDRLVCDLASGKKKWEMCVPPQDSDTDMVLIKLPREAVPRLLEMVEKAVGCLDHFRLGHGTLASVRVEECLAELSALAGKGEK